MDKKDKPKVLDIDYVESMSNTEPKNDTEGVDNFKKWFKQRR